MGAVLSRSRSLAAFAPASTLAPRTSSLNPFLLRTHSRVASLAQSLSGDTYCLSLGGPSPGPSPLHATIFKAPPSSYPERYLFVSPVPLATAAPSTASLKMSPTPYAPFLSLRSPVPALFPLLSPLLALSLSTRVHVYRKRHILANATQ